MISVPFGVDLVPPKPDGSGLNEDADQQQSQRENQYIEERDELLRQRLISEL